VGCTIQGSNPSRFQRLSSCLKRPGWLAQAHLLCVPGFFPIGTSI
jgi:hypothetical protein